MRIIEMESTVDQQRKLIIPACVMDDMGLLPGDRVKLACISKSPDDPRNAFSELLNAPGGITGLDEMEEGEITLPNKLLKTANIPVDSDLDIVCTEGAIIIMAADLLDIIPDELCHLFAELGISPDTVRSVIKNGGVLDGQ